MSGDSTESDEMDTNSVASGRCAYEPTDEELLGWQERQIAKCIVDNTVNRVVESYLTFFEDDVGDDIVADAFPDFQDPAVPFFEPINDRRLEESAILWAIDEHGLQQHINRSNIEHSESTSRSSTPSDTSIHSQGPSGSPATNAQSPAPTPSQISAQWIDHNRDDTVAIALNDASGSHEAEMVMQIGKEAPSIDKHALADATPTATTSTGANEHRINDSEHFDFMEAAVAVAIQKKGLAPYSIQMSPKR